MNRHTDAAYDTELAQLSTHVSHMAATAESMLADATRCLLQRDPELARRVIRSDDQLDGLELEADRRAVSVLARRSPVGEDLRFVTAVLKVVTDVERVGDIAVNIAERSLEIMREPGIEPPAELEALAKAATDLFHRAMAAWRARDPAAARLLPDEDRVVDQLNRAAFARLIALTHAHPDQFERALSLLSICRSLERIGDHGVNVGERVIYWLEGKDTRHGGE